MRVTVLRGGPSSERDVSLVSGRAVAQGLRDAGHAVFESDILPDDLRGLDHACDVVFPVLHGAFGESGELQEILEGRGMPFVGSGSRASRLGIDKAATKRTWESAGLPTPPYRVITSLSEPPPQEPCVVKALDAGSSIDVFLCRGRPTDAINAVAAVRQVVERYGRALVEQFIDGPELTVGLLEERALAPIRIVPKRDFFDYEAKYQSSETEHRFGTGLSAESVALVQRLAEQANAAVGARDLARIDVMLDAAGRPYLLEINTMPGFTPKSLLPEAAAHAGINFAALVDRLVRRAAARGPC